MTQRKIAARALLGLDGATGVAQYVDALEAALELLPEDERPAALDLVGLASEGGSGGLVDSADLAVAVLTGQPVPWAALGALLGAAGWPSVTARAIAAVRERL